MNAYDVAHAHDLVRERADITVRRPDSHVDNRQRNFAKFLPG